VNLNYANQLNYGDKLVSGTLTPLDSHFSGRPMIASGLTALTNNVTVHTYDTWSLYYERDGVDQDGDGVVDQGFDGVDNDGANGVDDPGEYETSAPYPVPLRGIEASIRMMEFNTRQVRQVSVVSDFLPE